MSSNPTERDPVNVESGNSPPSYGSGETSDQKPPSYSSVIEQIKNAQKTSGTRGDFATNCCRIVTDTIGFTICNILLLALPIAMIVIGALNLYNCPVERFVPIWLVVAGSTSLMLQLVGIGASICRKCRKVKDCEENKEVRKHLSSYNGVVGCFNFAWFIAGNVWVYSIYAPNTSNPLAPQYCDFTTYYLAFWVITATYIMIGLALCCCWGLCCFLCKDVGKATNDEPKDETTAKPTDDKPTTELLE